MGKNSCNEVPCQNNCTISVIIPVFNTGKELERCVDSILNQTYKKLEVIIVDDGSSKETAQICDSIQKKDNRIKIIHQSNQGVSAARNCGIKQARGQWVYFMDSDDCVEKIMLSTMLNTAENKKCDLIICGYYNVIGDKQLVANSVPDIILKSTKDINNNMIYLWDNSLMYNVWNKLFRRDLIDRGNVLFPVGKAFNEDRDFIREYLQIADSIAVIHNCFYYYKKENDKSAVGRYCPDKLLIRKKEYHDLKNFFIKRGIYSAEAKEYVAREHFDRIVGCTEEIFRYHEFSYRDRRNEIRKILSDTDTQEAIVFASPKSKKMRIIKTVYGTNSILLIYVMTMIISLVRNKCPWLFYQLRQRR